MLRLTLSVLLLSGCTTVGTLHNPACIIFCQNNGADSITIDKPIEAPVTMPKRN